MLPDNYEINALLTNLKDRIEKMQRMLRVPESRERAAELEQLTLEGDFWNQKERAQSLLKEIADCKNRIGDYEEMARAFEDASTLIEMAKEEKDDAVLLEGWEGLQQVDAKIGQIELRQMLSGELDTQNALVNINAGAGGVDAMDWAEMLQRMFLRYAQRMSYKATLLDVNQGAEAGIMNCTIIIEGAYAYGYLKAESGVHRLVRMSPFDAAARRHTAFASVLVTPDLDDTIEIEIRDEDLRVDVYRSSGAGGQHVNKTESAVRLTHLPTGCVAACQNERSQFQNKATAMRMLRSQLYALKQKEQEARMDGIIGTKQKIDFGSQIRSYVLAPYRLVTDHRTELKIGNVDSVLDGDLQPFITALLVQQQEEKGV
ncbi:peptide chain release factor 2 [Myxococcota bacterium]|nr:peptide chain release factor 2 [Myxococcota bacterium]